MGRIGEGMGTGSKLLLVSLGIFLICTILFSSVAFANEEQKIVKFTVVNQNTLSVTTMGYAINSAYLTAEELSKIKASYEYVLGSQIKIFQITETGNLYLELNGDFLNEIKMRAVPYNYSLYLPLSLDVMEFEVPSGFSVTSATPGGQLNGDKASFSSYHPQKEYIIQFGKTGKLSLSLVQAASIESVTPFVASTKLPIHSINVSDANSESRFLIPGYEMYLENEIIPGSGKTAAQIAEMYKPYFVKVSDANFPNEVRYRIIRGYDPYAGISNSILIQYIPYFNKQNGLLVDHCNDYEPIFVWVQNIGERPYKISFDQLEILDKIHKNGVLIDFEKDSSWKSYYLQSTFWNHDEIGDIYTQPSSFFPQGSFYYNPYKRSYFIFTEIPAQVQMANMMGHTQNFIDTAHLKIRIATSFQTYDLDITDNDGGISQNYSPLPLDDATLTSWYTTDMSTSCSYEKIYFPYDISDPFHGLFWEIADIDGKLPTLSATITSVSLSGSSIVAQVTATYDNTNVVGSVGAANQPLVGLWEDRFTAEVEGQSLGQATSINEYAAGKYTLTFNKGNYATGKTIKIKVQDNVEQSVNRTYTADSGGLGGGSGGSGGGGSGGSTGRKAGGINFSNIDFDFINTCENTGDIK
ncbi:TPA: hypothetical protein H1016_03785, partial [archaeon]|nr:hypothetical protein [Candidatus Naiadarchaeum limnaeum]